MERLNLMVEYSRFTARTAPDSRPLSAALHMPTLSLIHICVNFDRNMQALPRNFFYEDKVGRNIAVDVRGIQEALRNLYGATALADELISGTLSAPSAGKAAQ